MRFIIDREIYFRPADGALWHVDTEHEKLFLTPAASRLFAWLIEQQGRILSRNEIFQAVWEDYGLHSSNNTLNQYISLLRRTLKDFGLKTPVIKTIPKAGFLLNPDVPIVRDPVPLFFNLKRERSLPVKDLLLLALTITLLVLLVSLWRIHSSQQLTAAASPGGAPEQSSPHTPVPAQDEPG